MTLRDTGVRGDPLGADTEAEDPAPTRRTAGGPSQDRPGLVGLAPPPENAGLLETMETLAAAGGESVSAILLYGSHVQDSAPTVWSAYDLLVVTDGYRKFYRSLADNGHHRRAPWLLSTLAHVLPPNIVAFDLGRADQPISKCAVFSARHFLRGLGPRARDHFLKGRVVQKLALLWVRSPEDEANVEEGIRTAREDTARWVRPFLPGPFSLEEFAETMLRVSYGGEIRPEHPDRVTQVFHAQKDILLEISRGSLETAGDRGLVSLDGDTYRWTKKSNRGARAFLSAYFTLSKIRATARWFKYTFTFEGWMDYAQRKVERRAGLEIEVTDRERKWPLVFIWPKFFRVLRMLRKKDLPDRTDGDSVSGVENQGPSE